MSAEHAHPVQRELDLASLRLSPGEGRRMTLSTPIEPLLLGSEHYSARALAPAASDAGPELPAGEEGVSAEATEIPLELSVSRMTGGGYALRIHMRAAVAGPCMRCLKPAAPVVEVEAREVEVAGGGEELDSPYVRDDVLDLAGWAHDAFALALPAKVLCREDCAGLCPQCAVDLNEAGPEHRHEPAPDPRWAKLRDLEIG